MRGGVLPLALLFAALGLALAYAPRRAAWVLSLLALLVTLSACTLLSIPHTWLEGVFLGCWISVILAAATAYRPCGPSVLLAVTLAINTGLWASAVASLSGTPVDLLKALPWVFLFVPASWAVMRQASIAVRVVASWIIAVSVLAAALQLLPVTPGYLPDHLE